MSRTPRQPSPRTAKLRVDSTSTPGECKCHFRNSWFRCVTICRLTKVIALEEASEESLDLEFAVGEGQTPRTRESDRAGYLENFSVRMGNCSEEFTNSAKCRTAAERWYARLRRAQELKFWSTVLVLSIKACSQASCGPGQMSDQDRSRGREKNTSWPEPTARTK